MRGTDETERPTTTRGLPSRPLRKRHWWRWALAGVVLVIAGVVASIGSFINTPAPAPLALPAAAASAPVGPLDGAWDVAHGSVGGFRIEQSAVGTSNDTVGRTNAVTGTMSISADQVTSATFRIDLATITVGGKPQPQFVTSLDTQSDPSATFTLTQPMTLDSSLASGATATGNVTGLLVMHGASHQVTFTVSERRDGAALQVAGSTPITLSDWGIVGPKGFGVLGALADHGVAEVLLVLQRR